jgi:hypothetical protein
MMKLQLGRYTAFILCIVLALLSMWRGWPIAAAIFGALTGLGAWNLVQTDHSILRNYPVIGHIRWLVELR